MSWFYFGVVTENPEDLVGYPIRPRGVSLIEYEVEEVLDKRDNNGRIEYLLKWKDYPHKQNTWEPIHHINADELVNDYERKMGNRPARGSRSNQ